jgi:hypothetical protein
MSDSSIVYDQTLQRICSEFLEMPGLQVTLAQARRLWGLDECVCVDVLESLVEAKFLCRRGHDSYARLTDGRVALPLFRMAKAQLAIDVPPVAEHVG